MRLTSTLLTSLAAAVLSSVVPAGAADYDPPIFVEEAPEYTPVEVGSGWYLRGDIGYAFSTKTAGAFDYRTYNPVLGTYGQSNFLTQRLRSDLTYGGGFGFRYNEWLRADVTVDGFKTRFSGTTASAAPCFDIVALPAYAGTSCRSEDGATMSSVSFMANGYVDLGTYAGFTPYAGAGAGYSYVTWSNLSNNAYCVGATCPAGFAYSANHEGTKSWRFTYGLMAGLAYDISNNMKVDVGYKFRRIASGQMFNFDALSRAAGAAGTQGRDKGLSTHEIRVGLRYELW